MSNANFSPAQCRAARGLLGWSQVTLAERAGVGLSTVRDLETERRQVSVELVEAMQRACEQSGVDFIPENGGGAGLRLRRGARK